MKIRIKNNNLLNFKRTLIVDVWSLKRGAPSRAGPGAVAPLATLKRRLWPHGPSRRDWVKKWRLVKRSLSSTYQTLSQPAWLNSTLPKTHLPYDTLNYIQTMSRSAQGPTQTALTAGTAARAWSFPFSHILWWRYEWAWALKESIIQRLLMFERKILRTFLYQLKKIMVTGESKQT